MAERDLQRLLASLAPSCDDVEWVFCTVGEVPGAVEPIVRVVEDEGLTIVVRRAEADGLALPYDYVAARITLRVHSALDAVGLTAAVSSALAEAGISANVVAGYFHDHVFVPFPRRAEAMALLGGG